MKRGTWPAVSSSRGSGERRAASRTLRERRSEARDSLAAAPRSSLSVESRAASRTPRGGRTEPETPWPQQFEVRLLRGARQPPELPGDEDRARDSLAAARFDNRPHPCKQGDVFKSQGGSAAYRTPRVKGVTPMIPITIKTRIFVSSTRKKKPESSRKRYSEEEKTAKICKKSKFFPLREWSVSKKDFLETSEQYL